MKTRLLLTGLLFYGANLMAQIPTGFKNSTLSKSLVPVSKLETSGKTIYKTTNLILYNYDSLKIAALKPKLESLTNTLYENSKGVGTVFADTTQARMIKQRLALEKQIAQLEKHKDSLYFGYVKEYVEYKKVFILDFGPLRSRAFFDLLYDNKGSRFKALANSGINFGNQTGSIFSELVSGNLGLFRVSLGTMVSSSSSDDTDGGKSEEAYQRLVSYGGNTVLSFEYPLTYLHSGNNHYNLISRAILKGTADLPAFGTDTDNWAGSGSLGIDVYADAAIDNESLRFFFNANFNGIYGSTEFRDNLGISNSKFTFGQLTAGFTFLENFKISFVLLTFSSEKNLRNRHVVVGGQVMK